MIGNNRDYWHLPASILALLTHIALSETSFVTCHKSVQGLKLVIRLLDLQRVHLSCRVLAAALLRLALCFQVILDLSVAVFLI